MRQAQAFLCAELGCTGMHSAVELTRAGKLAILCHCIILNVSSLSEGVCFACVGADVRFVWCVGRRFYQGPTGTFTLDFTDGTVTSVYARSGSCAQFQNNNCTQGCDVVVHVPVNPPTNGYRGIIRINQLNDNLAELLTVLFSVGWVG